MYLHLRTFMSFFLAFTLVLSPLPARGEGQDGGTDAPRIVRLEGSYLVNEVAFRAIDIEVQRLQQVERNHKAESWSQIVIISVLVGLALGVPIGFGLGYGVLSLKK